MAGNEENKKSDAHFLVYKLTDPEGKIYIGYTGDDLASRVSKGYNRRKKHTPIGLAFEIYGKSAIKKEILCENLTKECAEAMEKWYIDYYGSLDPEIGYNRVTGGDHKGTHWCKDLREQVSRAKKKEARSGKYDYFYYCDKHAKPVICVEKGTYYPSIFQAKTQTGISSINMVCNGQLRKAGGYHWRYATAEEIAMHTA